ncbi:helix-turn-helix domain-containing protein [Flagellimonas nanhaiensis]|uniref:AraC family transcriptional regulator n=1 Tax=Flagellimonas nanhaiensis TaxID=2292706 RepID=A0A371JUV2_9FLAO|nr:helix-turn-helix transcriptional regulator [Allomuricauda nanhaiensis]RDY61557.1 AraC family transcriptional regulator [Allomuricauda nanhaiensis]
MDIWRIIIAVVCGIAICQGLFLSFYILAKNTKKFTPIVFLSLMLLALTLRISKSYYYYLFSEVPFWTVMLALAGLWAIGPSFWLYTLSSKPSKLRKADYFHYLPAILLVISSFFSDSSWKVISLYKIGALLVFSYAVTSFIFFKYGDWNGNRKRFILFGSSVGAIALIFVFQSYLANIQGYTIGNILTLVILYVINFMLLKDRKLLQINRKPKKEQSEVLDSIYEKITVLFDKEKVYRRKGLTLTNLSQELQHPIYLISQAIKEHRGVKFNSFVNSYRVIEVKNRLQDLEANDKIEVIAKEVGFSSTSSLYKAFKEQTNVTPQAYRKEHVNLAQTQCK